MQGLLCEPVIIGEKYYGPRFLWHGGIQQCDMVANVTRKDCKYYWSTAIFVIGDQVEMVSEDQLSPWTSCPPRHLVLGLDVPRQDRLSPPPPAQSCNRVSMWKCCHAVDSPPSKTVPPDCPRQNNWSPRIKFRSYTWSPLLPTAAFSKLPLPQRLHMENSLGTACSIKTR